MMKKFLKILVISFPFMFAVNLWALETSPYPLKLNKDDIKWFFNLGINEETKRGILFHAVRINDQPIVEWLLDNGLDVNSKDADGITALYIAAEQGHASLIELLLKRKASVAAHTFSESLLHAAAWGQHEGAAKLLIAAGADLAAKNHQGLTPFDYAYQNKVYTLAKLFAAVLEYQNKSFPVTDSKEVEMGRHIGLAMREAEANSTKYPQSQNPEHVAIIEFIKALSQKPKPGAISAIDKNPFILLLRAKKDLRKLCREGLRHEEKKNIYFHAAKISDNETVALLLDEGVEIESTDEVDHTALHIAALAGNAPLTEWLISKKANVNAKKNPSLETPLHQAAYNGHEKAAKFLIAAGANLTAQTTNLATPLDYACQEGHLRLAKLFAAVLAYKGQGFRVSNEQVEIGKEIGIAMREAELNHRDYPQSKNSEHVAIIQFIKTLNQRKLRSRI